MRPAANAWEADYATTLESIRFCRGKPAPTVFFMPSRDADAWFTVTILPSLVLISNCMKLLEKCENGMS
jgi:hypothetical protein